MSESRIYRILKRTEKGEMLELMYLEINGDKSTIIFSTDERTSYQNSNLEQLSDEEAEKVLSGEYNYHPAP